MKKSKLSVIVLSALLIAGVAVVKNQNCKSIVYDNVEALTAGGDTSAEPGTERIWNTLACTNDEIKYTAEGNQKDGYTGYCQETHQWYDDTDYYCTLKK